MNRYIYGWMLLLFLSPSCASIKSKAGIEYRSVCTLYHVYPSLIVYLNTDGTFIYKMALLDEKITGKWHIQKKRLIMESEFFTKAYIDKLVDSRRSEILLKDDTLLTRIFTKDFIRHSIPGYKYTHNEQKEIFLIKRNKLIAVDSNGVRRYCWLQKIK